MQARADPPRPHPFLSVSTSSNAPVSSASRSSQELVSQAALCPLDIARNRRRQVALVGSAVSTGVGFSSELSPALTPIPLATAPLPSVITPPRKTGSPPAVVPSATAPPAMTSAPSTASLAASRPIAVALAIQSTVAQAASASLPRSISSASLPGPSSSSHSDQTEATSSQRPSPRVRMCLSPQELSNSNT